jgi:hypothetical protein
MKLIKLYKILDLFKSNKNEIGINELEHYINTYKVINNENRLKQNIVFGPEMKYIRNIRPTDIDGCLEFGGNLFIFIETKKVGNGFLTGQESCHRRICEKLAKAGCYAAIIMTEHDTNFDEDIILSETKCSFVYNCFYFNDKTEIENINNKGFFEWVDVRNKNINCHDMVNKIINYCEKKLKLDI